MNKAFIFDMDGVIVDSETIWLQREEKFLTELLGRKIYLKIKDVLLGSTIKAIYEKAQENGYQIDFKDFVARYDKEAMDIYKQAKINPEIDTLTELLISLKFKIGLVTSSRKSWIDQVLPKLKNFQAFECIISIGERKDLRSKPAPDGYLEAIKTLRSVPEKTIILEDSNKGIASAKASGAITICLKEYLPAGYIPTGADIYFEKLSDLIKILEALK